MELNAFQKEFVLFYKNHFKKLYNEFYFWLTGIEEDTPLPYEIKYVAFILNIKNNLFSLSYTGFETEPNILIPSEYIPLEGEYFFNAYLLKLNKINASLEDKKEFLTFLTKRLVTQFLKEKESKFLKGKKVIIDFLFSRS